jgi:hypothetical protein
MRMKRVSQGKAEVIHVETDLGIVNIYVKLHDQDGRRVERIEYLPNRYAGERPVRTLDRVSTIIAYEDVGAAAAD